MKRGLSLARSRAAGAVVAQVFAGRRQLRAADRGGLDAGSGLGSRPDQPGARDRGVGTALASGMIGDSLVILDRSKPAVRGALPAWALLLGAATGVVAAIGMGATVLTPLQALLFAGALVAFQFEELVRRVFMGLMQFWRLVIVDAVAVGAPWRSSAPSPVPTPSPSSRSSEHSCRAGGGHPRRHRPAAGGRAGLGPDAWLRVSSGWRFRRVARCPGGGAATDADRCPGCWSSPSPAEWPSAWSRPPGSSSRRRC